MPDIINHARQRIEAGDLAIGVGLRQARTVDVGPIMKSCGYDWLFIDLEHNTMTLDTAAQISVAAEAAGITPVVRVHALALHDATRVLDGGALGVVVPHVDTPERAAEVVAWCKYPPIGKRSITGAIPQLGFRSLPIPEATAAINAATLVVVMLETPLAVANAAAIAAVPGVDALLVGTNDLTIEMGIGGQIGHPRVAEAYENRPCRLLGARRLSRSGRRLPARPDGTLRGHGLPADPGRQRSPVHDDCREGAIRFPARS